MSLLDEALNEPKKEKPKDDLQIELSEYKDKLIKLTKKEFDGILYRYFKEASNWNIYCDKIYEKSLFSRPVIKYVGIYKYYTDGQKLYTSSDRKNVKEVNREQAMLDLMHSMFTLTNREEIFTIDRAINSTSLERTVYRYNPDMDINERITEREMIESFMQTPPEERVKEWIRDILKKN